MDHVEVEPRKFSLGIAVSALLEEIDAVARLPQVPGVLVKFAPEAAVSVQHYYYRLRFGMRGKIVIEPESVSGSKASIKHMPLPPDAVFSIHGGEIIFFAEKMNICF